MSGVTALKTWGGSWILLVGAILAWVSYKIVYTLYWAFLGPLSKYPGPTLNALSRLPFTRQKLQGRDPFYLHKLHLKYGPIVRVMPNLLSYTDGQAFKDIYGHYSTVRGGIKTGQFSKDPEFYCMDVPGFDELLLAPDGDHSRMRRNFANAFSDQALRRQESTIREYTDQFCGLLNRAAVSDSPVVNMSHVLNYVTFDIMADLSFGEPLGCLKTGATHPWVEETFATFKIVPVVQEMYQYPWLASIINRFTSKAVREGRIVSFQYAKEKMKEKMARQDDRPDIWGVALNAKDDYKLTEPEIFGNCRLMMAAGTETTSSLLSALMYYLLRNPVKMEKLVNEIRSSFTSADQINLNSLKQLSYLNACLEEALRIFPPAPSYLPRLVPKGGAVVCGEPLPENTSVAAPHFAAFHSPENFKRPDEFIPERWLGEAEFDNDNRACVLPFSTGPRVCLGKNLAYLEMRMILSNVLYRFDLALEPEVKDWENQKAFVGWEKPPLPIRVTVA